MTDLPSSNPEIPKNLPENPNPQIESVNYTQNDTGAKPVTTERTHTEPVSEQLEPNEAMPDFAISLRNIADGYKSIFQYVNDDGSFVDATFDGETGEEKAVKAWNHWYSERILPDFTEGTENETMELIQTQIEQVKKGEAFLSYNDRVSLISYFKNKYPTEQKSITDIFADFDHDVEFVTSGMNHAFVSHADKVTTEDDEEHIKFTGYRQSPLREWPAEIMESVAQLLEKNLIKEPFNPVQPITEIRDMFRSITAVDGTHFKVEIDESNPNFIKNITLFGNRLWFKRAMYNHARNVHKYAETAQKDTQKRYYDKFFFEKVDDKTLNLSTEDNRDGFRGSNYDLIDPTKSEEVYTPDKTKTVKRALVFARGKKGSESGGKGFGMNIYWQVLTNMFHGKISAKNWVKETALPSGSRFYNFLPMAPIEQNG